MSPNRRRWLSLSEFQGLPPAGHPEGDTERGAPDDGYALHCHELAFVVAAAALDRAVSLIFGLSSDVTDQGAQLVAMGIGLACVIAYAGVWYRRGGWVIVDSARQQVVWKRPGRRRPPGGAWDSAQVRLIRPRWPGPMTAGIDVGNHVLRVRASRASVERIDAALSRPIDPSAPADRRPSRVDA